MVTLERNKGRKLRTLLLLFCVKLTAILTIVSFAADDRPPVAAQETTPSSEATARESSLRLASTNSQLLLEATARKPAALVPGRHDSNVARLVSLILLQSHYLQQPLDKEVSGKLVDRYIDVLDNLRLHFLQSDLREFDSYRANAAELIRKNGDTQPGREIFTRFLERLGQRVTHVAELLENEVFEFDGNDRYSPNRKGAERPKDLAEARQLWRQHLRYEVLQEKLNNEKPEEIASKVARRYARLLRMYQDLDNNDIFEIYLSALTHVYDPHSDYMGKSSLDSFAIGMNLSLFGIGALLQSEDGYCTIKELMPGPAAKSKMIKPKDRIIAVAQEGGEPVDVVDMPLKKVVELIRGPKGSKVTLTIIPADAADPSMRNLVTLERDEIKLEDQQAKAKIIDLPQEDGKLARLGVIDLPSFYASFERIADAEPRSTTVDVAKLLRKLKRENVEGIILDLRRNGGGSLEEAINLTGLFIKEGPIVQVRDYTGKIMVDRDTDPTVLYDGPLVVLTSRFSASASEILAGALQDYGRALIVGDSSTHGKGTVQSLIRLDRPEFGSRIQNPGALKLTIRKFYRASGASTQLKGIVPDIVLPSPNNYAEVGEASLDNPLPHDWIRSAEFDKLDLIHPVLPELQHRSNQRIKTDQDFIYLQEDIEQYRRLLADRSVSLNYQQRLNEKEEAAAKQKARQAELLARAESGEKVYEITLKHVDEPGLPEPVSKSQQLARSGRPFGAAVDHPDVAQSEPARSEDGNQEAGEELLDGEPKAPSVDVTLSEAKRIMADLISLWPKATSVAATTAVTPRQAGGAQAGAD
jgi:carboxyl-terminal processing protease